MMCTYLVTCLPRFISQFSALGVGNMLTLMRLVAIAMQHSHFMAERGYSREEKGMTLVISHGISMLGRVTAFCKRWNQHLEFRSEGMHKQTLSIMWQVRVLRLIWLNL